MVAAAAAAATAVVLKSAPSLKVAVPPSDTMGRPFDQRKQRCVHVQNATAGVGAVHRAGAGFLSLVKDPLTTALLLHTQLL